MTMTKDELETKYKTVYKILYRERKMREHVFAEGDPRRVQKLAEIDTAMKVLEEFKDALKEGMEPDYEQPRLLDAPQKASYL